MKSFSSIMNINDNMKSSSAMVSVHVSIKEIALLRLSLLRANSVAVPEEGAGAESKKCECAEKRDRVYKEESAPSPEALYGDCSPEGRDEVDCSQKKRRVNQHGTIKFDSFLPVDDIMVLQPKRRRVQRRCSVTKYSLQATETVLATIFQEDPAISKDYSS